MPWRQRVRALCYFALVVTIAGSWLSIGVALTFASRDSLELPTFGLPEVPTLDGVFLGFFAVLPMVAVLLVADGIRGFSDAARFPFRHEDSRGREQYGVCLRWLKWWCSPETREDIELILDQLRRDRRAMLKEGRGRSYVWAVLRFREFTSIAAIVVHGLRGAILAALGIKALLKVFRPD